jgi:hypothetical protein
MDGVFFLKSTPQRASLGKDVKLVGLDPVSMGFACGGEDKYCSTAYSQMWSALGGKAGVMPTLRKKYGIDGRVAFVSFSAGHGFMNPLLNVDSDRADVSAVLLVDSTFGGGKTGYVKAAIDASFGKLLLATATSNTGGDKDWRKYVWDPAIEATGKTPQKVPARAPMPEPSGGVMQLGDLCVYYRFVDEKGGTEMPHWQMGKIQNKFVDATLAPYWAGALGGASLLDGDWKKWLPVVVGAAGATAAIWWLLRGRGSQLEQLELEEDDG